MTLPDVEVTLAKLRIRAEIRRRIRAEGDRIAEVCDESAAQIVFLKDHLLALADKYNTVNQRLKHWEDRATVAESRVAQLERELYS